MTWDNLLEGHVAFQKLFATRRELYASLTEGQAPVALWIGCVDSRVVPEHIVGAEPGELMVVRNVANIVPPEGTANDAVGSAIEFAVGTLGVPHAVLCGHTECGGVAALEQDLSQSRQPHLTRWVEWARQARSQVEASGIPEESRYLETVRANVLLQRANLLTYQVVRDALNAGALTVHAWLYDLHDGSLSRYDDETNSWLPLLQA